MGGRMATVCGRSHARTVVSEIGVELAETGERLFFSGESSRLADMQPLADGTEVLSRLTLDEAGLQLTIGRRRNRCDEYAMYLGVEPLAAAANTSVERALEVQADGLLGEGIRQLARKAGDDVTEASRSVTADEQPEVRGLLHDLWYYHNVDVAESEAERQTADDHQDMWLRTSKASSSGNE